METLNIILASIVSLLVCLELGTAHTYFHKDQNSNIFFYLYSMLT